MNKLVKGSIASAAGIALLLGGAGTLALWNDSSSIADTTVNSGKLTLATSITDGWDTIPALIVPGDTFSYSADLVVTAAGDNLEAVLSLDEGSIAAATAGNSADEDLADELVVVVDHGTLPAGVTFDSVAGTFSVSPSVGTITIPVSVEVTLPGNVSDLVAQNGHVSFTGFGFVLQQV